MGALSSLFRSRGIGTSSADWERLAQHWGDYYGVDPALILAVINEESRGDSNAQGAAGESGLMQVKSATVSWMLGRPVSADELRDPNLNIQAGTAYLAWQQERYGGDVASIVNAYRAGTASDTPRSQSYVARVLAYFNSLVTPAPAEATEMVYEMEPIVVTPSGESFQRPTTAWDLARRYWYVGVGAVLLLLMARRG